MADALPRETLDSAVKPTAVARQTFDLERRGYSQGQVRDYLNAVAESLRDAQDREADIRTRLGKAIRRAERAEAAAKPPTAPADLSRAVGEEVAGVLEAARVAGEARVAAAEKSAEQLLGNAKSEATSIRRAAESVMGERRAEADKAAAEIRGRADAEAQRLVEEARLDAQAMRADAAADVERARAEGDALIHEAEEARKQILLDMDRRRRQARAQVERLRVGRDRLLRSYDVVRRTLDESTTELKSSLAEAKVLGDSAGRKAASAALSTPHQLEAEMADARLIGRTGGGPSRGGAPGTEGDTGRRAEPAPQRTGAAETSGPVLRDGGPQNAPVAPTPKRPVVTDRSTLRPPKVAPIIKKVDDSTTEASIQTGVADTAVAETAVRGKPAAGGDQDRRVMRTDDRPVEAHAETIEADEPDRGVAASPVSVDTQVADTPAAETADAQAVETEAVELDADAAAVEIDAADTEAADTEAVETDAADTEAADAAAVELADAEASATAETDAGSAITDEDFADLPDHEISIIEPSDEIEQVIALAPVKPAIETKPGAETKPAAETKPGADTKPAADTKPEVEHSADVEPAGQAGAGAPKASGLFDALRAQAAPEPDAVTDSAAADTDESETAASAVANADQGAVADTDESETAASAAADTGETAVAGTGESETAASAAAEIEAAADLARQRNAVVAELAIDVERRLKRALADEQNDVLAGIRAAGRSPVELISLVGDSDDHVARYIVAINEVAGAAYGAGGALLDGTPTESGMPAGAVEELLATEVVVPLRLRLLELDAVGADMPTVHLDAVRAFYRQRKTDHLTRAAELVASLLVNAGACDVLAADEPVPWAGAAR